MVFHYARTTSDVTFSTAYSLFFTGKRGAEIIFFQLRLGNDQAPVVQTLDGAVAAFDNSLSSGCLLAICIIRQIDVFTLRYPPFE